MVQCLLRHGASWCEDGVGDLLCKAVGSFSSLFRTNEILERRRIYVHVYLHSDL